MTTPAPPSPAPPEPRRRRRRRAEARSSDFSARLAGATPTSGSASLRPPSACGVSFSRENRSSPVSLLDPTADPLLRASRAAAQSSCVWRLRSGPARVPWHQPTPAPRLSPLPRRRLSLSPPELAPAEPSLRLLFPKALRASRKKTPSLQTPGPTHRSGSGRPFALDQLVSSFALFSTRPHLSTFAPHALSLTHTHAHTPNRRTTKPHHPPCAGLAAPSAAPFRRWAPRPRPSAADRADASLVGVWPTILRSTERSELRPRRPVLPPPQPRWSPDAGRTRSHHAASRAPTTVSLYNAEHPIRCRPRARARLFSRRSARTSPAPRRLHPLPLLLGGARRRPARRLRPRRRGKPSDATETPSRLHSLLL